MADYLSQISQGLRGAAGILNPEVQKETFAADERQKLMAQQFILSQQTPQAKLANEQFQNEIKFRKAAAEAQGDEAKLALAASQFGKPELAVQIYNAKEARLARDKQSRETLEARKEQIQLNHEIRLQNITNMADRTSEITRHNLQMEVLEKQNQALRASEGEANRILKALQIEMMGNNKNQANDARIDRATESFANHLQQNKLPALQASMDAANTLLKKYEKTDIPGFGFVEGSDKIPNILRGEEGNNVRSAVKAVTNDLLNLYSGLAVTLPESERRTLEQMQSGDFTTSDFKNSWPRIVQRFNTVKGNMAAGASNEARERYRSRPGAISLDPITPAFQATKASAGTAPKGVDAKVWEAMTSEERALWQK